MHDCDRESSKTEHVLEYLAIFTYMCIYACCLSVDVCINVWTVDRRTGGPPGVEEQGRQQ